MFSLKSSADIKSWAQVQDEFVNLISQLNTWAQQQHNNDGSHGDVTASSVALGGTKIGTIIPLPVSGALFSTSDGGIWTVNPADVLIFEYMQFNQLVWFQFIINTSTLTGTPPTNLFINLPQFNIPLSKAILPNNDATAYCGGMAEWIDWQHGLTSNSGPVFAQNTSVGSGLPAAPHLFLLAQNTFNGTVFPLSNNLSVRGFCFFPIVPGNTPQF